MRLFEVTDPVRNHQTLRIWLVADTIVNITDLPAGLSSRQFLNKLLARAGNESNQTFVLEWAQDIMDYPHSPLVVTPDELYDYHVRRMYMEARNVTLTQVLEHILTGEFKAPGAR